MESAGHLEGCAIFGDFIDAREAAVIAETGENIVDQLFGTDEIIELSPPAITSAPKRRKKDTTARRWCVTINNPTELPTTLEGRLKAHPKVVFLCFALEEGEEKTPHYQMYLRFSEGVRFTALKKLFGHGAHIEVAMGNEAQNIAYCSKDPVDGPWGFGTPMKGRGARSDLHGAVEVLRDAGGEMAAVVQSDPCVYVKFHRGMEMLAAFYRKNTDRGPCTVEIYWGESGTGKSRKAQEENPDAYWWPRPQNSACYAGGYTAQKTIVLDEFSSPWLPITMILRLCDRYPLWLNTCGGQALCSANRVIFTSNTDPKTWWPNVEPEIRNAFYRRVTKTIHFQGPLVSTNLVTSREVSSQQWAPYSGAHQAGPYNGMESQ